MASITAASPVRVPILWPCNWAANWWWSPTTAWRCDARWALSRHRQGLRGSDTAGRKGDLLLTRDGCLQLGIDGDKLTWKQIWQKEPIDKKALTFDRGVVVVDDAIFGKDKRVDYQFPQNAGWFKPLFP